jgi:hypothetical protein
LSSNRNPAANPDTRDRDIPEPTTGFDGERRRWLIHGDPAHCGAFR